MKFIYPERVVVWCILGALRLVALAVIMSYTHKVARGASLSRDCRASSVFLDILKWGRRLCGLQ